MSNKILCLLFTAYCLLIYSCGNPSQKTVVTNPGQTIFENNCTACHGSDGKLCVLGAKDLSLSVLSHEQAMEIITNGKNTMTPFGSMLSKGEIDSVAAYIQILKK